MMTKDSLSLKISDRMLLKKKMRASIIKNSMSLNLNSSNNKIQRMTKSLILEGLRWNFSKKELEIF
jgi:hypothetical protein